MIIFEKVQNKERRMSVISCLYRCTGHCDITEILLKMALNTIQLNLIKSYPSQNKF